MTAKDFPPSNESFDLKIPKSAFKRLKEIDQTIYGETKETLATIGMTCSEFYNNDLHRMDQSKVSFFLDAMIYLIVNQSQQDSCVSLRWLT
jgi:hypothetical protein